MVGSRRQGWALYAAMLTLLVVGFAVLYAAQSGPTPAMQAAGLTGANLEGKEQRFGDAGTAPYAAVTTSGASGAVNGSMESLSGPQGFGEVLYAYVSQTMNNGSAFAGYTGFV